MLRTELHQQLNLDQTLLGNSLPMRTLKEEIKAVTKSDETVLVLGESGTGKELVAKAIHALNGHSGGPFITLNVPAIPHELIESELFGHKKGSFTGAVSDYEGAFRAADGGVLFLDEIGDMPYAFQAKLLRVLESGEVRKVGEAKASTVNLRVIAATNRDLASDVKNGKFRLDLFHRLNILPIQVPPLRERKDDIQLLAYHFLTGKDRHRRMTRRALCMLQAHDWPGNVRELKNALRRVCVFTDRNLLKWESFKFLNPEFDERSLPAVPDMMLAEEVPQESTPVPQQDVQRARRVNRRPRKPRKDAKDWPALITQACAENPGITLQTLAEKLALSKVWLYQIVRRHNLSHVTGTRLHYSKHNPRLKQ